MMPDMNYCKRTLELEPGDDIIMLTDGITEARTETDVFEREGVIRNLTKLGHAKPDEIAEALLQAAMAHAGGDLQDDAAIVVLACEGT